MNENHCTESGASVTEDGITVERTHEYQNDGIAGTLTIESDRDDSVMVHVVDEFPPTVTVEDAAFKPGDEPDIGEISSDRLSVRQTVDDDSVRIRFGIFPADPVTDDEWTPPTIRRIAEGAFTRSTDREGSAPDGASTGPRESEFLSRSQDSPGSAELDAEWISPRSSLSNERGEASAHGPSETSDPGRTENDGDHDTGRRTTDITDAETVIDRDESAERASEAADRDEAPVSNEFSGPGSPAGEVDHDHGDDISRSLELRIDRLSARVEEFAAYATALESIIDKYGAGTEVIDGIERDLADLDSRLGAVHDDLDSVRNDHSEDIDGVHATVDHVETRVSEVDDDVNTLESTVDQHGSRIESTRGDLTTLEDHVEELDDEIREIRDAVNAVQGDFSALSDDVESIRTELRDLHEEVSELNSFRKTLAEISTFDD